MNGSFVINESECTGSSELCAQPYCTDIVNRRMKNRDSVFNIIFQVNSGFIDSVYGLHKKMLKFKSIA